MMKKFLSLILALTLIAVQLPALGETWACPTCGQQNEGNFCANCGTARVDGWTCAVCGAVNTQNFCTNCGTPKAVGWTCPECGAQNEGNFCAQCGHSKPGNASAAPTVAPAVQGAIVDQGLCGDDAYWELDENGLVVISGPGPMWDYEYSSPKKSGTSPLFPYKDTVKAVQIQEGITAVGACLFYGATEIESVSLPASLISIHKEAFYSCSSLKEISFPSGLEEIQRDAFVKCALESVSIPASVKTIESFAFGMCTNLRSVAINGFITVNNGVISWFAGCTKLENVSIAEGLTVLPMRMFANCSSLREITIPASVTDIGGEAFSKCTGLQKVSIRSTRLQVHNKAFEDCVRLTSLTFTSPVDSLDLYYNVNAHDNFNEALDYWLEHTRIKRVEGISGKEIQDFASIIRADFMDINTGALVTPKPTVRTTPKPTPKPTAKPSHKPTATPKPTAKPTAKPGNDIERDFQDSIERLTCFERVRTFYQSVLGVMDVYGTDGGNDSSICINIVDLVNNSITLTGIATDGKWYNAIWMDLTQQQLYNALVIITENDAFVRRGLGKNKKYVLVVILDADHTLTVDSTEIARELLEVLTK